MDNPDSTHYENSVSMCTDGTFYNGSNKNDKIIVEG